MLHNSNANLANEYEVKDLVNGDFQKVATPQYRDANNLLVAGREDYVVHLNTDGTTILFRK